MIIGCCNESCLPPRTKEKAYAHFVGQASWAGARIIQGQWTPQAQKLYDLLILIFSDHGHIGDTEGLKQKSGVTEEEWEDILQYTSQVRASPNPIHPCYQ